MSKSSKALKLQKEYQVYLASVGGIGKNTMSYYQWLNKDRSQPAGDYGSPSRTDTYSVSRHRKAEQSALEGALDAEEIKKFKRS